MKIKYISFYTREGRDYSPAAKRLRESMDLVGLEHDIQRVDDRGSWQKMVRWKPNFIRQMMDKHKDADALVWIDADAIVHRDPKLFQTIKEDMAAYFHPWPGGKAPELLSGTFFVRNTPKVRAAMDAWIEAMKTAPKDLTKPEQMTLQGILPKLKLKVFHLPRSYCYISRREVWTGRRQQDIPFIQHTQWSREHRGKYRGPKTLNKNRPTPPDTIFTRTGVQIQTKKTRARRGVIYARRAQRKAALMAEKGKARKR